MSEGEKVGEAFCLLLWIDNGGQIDEIRGLPIAVQKRFGWAGENDPRYVRGKCTEPYDCYQCPIMAKEIQKYPPGYAFWVCSSCAKAASAESKERSLPFSLPGHFTEGQCQYKGCTRGPREEGGVQLPERYSRFLQLFIGPVNS